MATTLNQTTVFDFAPKDREALDAQVRALENLDRADFRELSPATADRFTQLRGAGTFASVKIPGSDPAVQLDAGVFVPLTAGPHPVVVMPAPLAPTGWRSYPGMLLNFALKGYLAVAYSERGLAESTGKIDVAGPRDRADGSAVIDWILENHADRVNPDQIGFAGSSYGAGQSLIIAAHDDRVKAVCAQSAWADLGRSLYENETRHIKAFEALAALFGEENLSDEVRRIFDDFRINKNIDQLLEFAAVRSPITYINRLNARRVPIFLGTYWHETIFSVPAVVDFFNELEGPRRLLVMIGDHGGDEILGFLGGISRPTATTFRWLDHYLLGKSNGIGEDGNVHTEYMHNLFDLRKSADWHSYTQPSRRFYLDQPRQGSTDGVLTSRPTSGWSMSINAGTDTPADVAELLVQTGMLERLGAPAVYETTSISRRDAAVWVTEPLAAQSQLTGNIRLRITARPSAATATLVAHLFDISPGTGKAKIITNAPFTLLNDREGETRTVEIQLQPADYRIPASHQIALVIDTKDDFFADATVPGTQIEISSPEGSASYLELPLADMAPSD
ncbi:CocE/NonD family hydrolase [Frankia sp. AgB32]|uniref:CocE/NonD family hydrolase n=1 Tax=Frankia sp. AgB32 TaxID=631119 RepID=UPI00200EEE6D|nr:CocE/NonD family hydrolase [Frankia sp. AgB32]MCK9896189.1 CocE/NonD family hydrolase [Frankia sp. AgB32]